MLLRRTLHAYSSPSYSFLYSTQYLHQVGHLAAIAQRKREQVRKTRCYADSLGENDVDIVS
jgi:hypothetical protein